MEVAPQPVAVVLAEQRGENAPDLGRIAGADRVRDRHLPRPGIEHPVGQLDHGRGSDLALVGAAAGRRHVSARGHAVAGGAAEHRRAHRDRALQRHVDVLAIECVAGGEDHRHRAGAGFGRAVVAPLVRHQGVIGDPVALGQAREQLAGVSQLRHRPRRDEAGRLERLDPGLDQRVDQAQLVVGGDEMRMHLQPVAQPDLVDVDLSRIDRPPHRCLAGAILVLPSRCRQGTGAPRRARLPHPHGQHQPAGAEPAERHEQSARGQPRDDEVHTHQRQFPDDEAVDR